MEGEKIDIELFHITSEGKGVGRTEDDKLVIVDNVKEEDESIRVIINKVFEETLFATKTSKSGRHSNAKKKEKESIYDIDEDEDEDEFEEEPWE